MLNGQGIKKPAQAGAILFKEEEMSDKKPNEPKKPECFGREYNPRCNDCTVGVECEKYSRQQMKESADPKNSENELALRIIELRNRELELEKIARLIFKHKIDKPFADLFQSMEHIYPERHSMDSLAPIVLQMARDTLDDLMDEF